jgi:hypothetical protein
VRPEHYARFRVEWIGTRFAIFDSRECSYRVCAPGTSRLDADKQCAELNTPTRKHAPEPPSLEREFEESGGITRERLELELDETGLPPEFFKSVVTPREQQLIDSYKTWLVPMLRTWADAVALQCGYGPTRRRSWYTYLIVKLIEADSFRFERAAKADDLIERLHWMFWPSNFMREYFDTDDTFELRMVLAVHYLSPDAAPVKAAYFGMSERTYLRYVDAAHRMIAGRWAA